METEISNDEGKMKQALYQRYKVKYGAAIKKECYLECIFIDYAMMEDRLTSILYYMGIVERRPGENSRWAKSPKIRRDGYRSVLSGMINKNGALPSFKNISAKIDALKVVAQSENKADESVSDYEQWLRTTVKEKLLASNIDDLVLSLNDWRKKRNELIHSLFKSSSIEFGDDELREIAVKGKELAERLDLISKKMKRSITAFEKSRKVKIKS